MGSPNRRRRIVSVVALSMCLAMTGCLHTGVDEPILYPTSSSSYLKNPMQPNATMAPPLITGTPSSPSSSGLKQASHTTHARFAGQAQPATPNDTVVAPPALGMPAPIGTMVPANLPLPGELKMTAHPPHRVAAPDILYIEALRLIPKGPYRLEPMEVLQIEINGAFKDQIKGLYMISPEGTINLGHTLRPISVAGLTVDRAQAAIVDYMRTVVKGELNVGVTLVQMRGMQNIRGEHLVRPDGTISLGMYGAVYVAGMTLGQVKAVIESHLGAYLIDPQVSVDVFAYNSRKIYIIADGAGYGQQVIALPATGNETVLDAIARVQGLPPVASLKKIWVARPSPAGNPCSQVLPVDWKAITQAGRTETNYQLLPGDRIYISADHLITVYNYIDKLVAPIERVLGVTLLGTSTVQSFRNNNNGGTGIFIAQ
jgi:polysaccharide export outer membrane protein